jgi:hypothetical protein
MEEKILKRLEDFAKKLESGEPIKVTTVRRYNTPDGPMHVAKKDFLKRKRKNEGRRP